MHAAFSLVSLKAFFTAFLQPSYNECSIFPLKSLLSLGTHGFFKEIRYINSRRIVENPVSNIYKAGLLLFFGSQEDLIKLALLQHCIHLLSSMAMSMGSHVRLCGAK